MKNQLQNFAERNSLLGSIATSVIGYEVEKMTGRDIFKYNLKLSGKVKTLPARASVRLSSKDEAIFFSVILFQRLVVLAKGCNISLEVCKGHEL